MIIGNGLLASAFKDRYAKATAVTIFASGVSNSTEANESEFLREKNLLLTSLENKNSRLVYFSTCSVLDQTLAIQPYTKHKLEMENIVQQSQKYAIFRLSQVVGKTTNPHTLTNFLYTKIKNCQTFQVWERATRNLIDIRDVSLAVDFFLTNYGNNLNLNLAAPESVPVLKIVKIFEQITSQKAQFDLLDKGAKIEIAVPELMRHERKIGLSFSADYVERILRKYYS